MDFNNNEKEQLQSGMIDDLKKQKYIHKKQIEEGVTSIIFKILGVVLKLAFYSAILYLVYIYMR